MTIFLDNNATTRPHPEVVRAVSEALSEIWGNASSVHGPGRSARQALESARASLARLIGAEPGEVVITSGGTESNNAAIFGRCRVAGNQRFHIVTTTIEHPAVLSVVSDLEEQGWDVTRVECGRDGRIATESIRSAISDDTGLVAVMLANNETGVIQPVGEIAELCRERGIHLHCDAVQAIGKIPVDVEQLGVDTLSISGHKFHGPKGIGAMYVRKGVTLSPFVLGGAQERRRRGGTENVPLAVGLGRAAELAMTEIDSMEKVRALRDQMERRLERSSEAVINGQSAARLPNTSSVTFPGCDAESVVIGLDMEGFAVSGGSACSSGRSEPSHVLRAMGLDDAAARSTIRISLCKTTTEDEIDQFVRAAERVTGMVRERVAG